MRAFQSLVGALLYCAVSTRPDIAYSVNMLCRVMSKPNDAMLRHAKRVLRYLHRHKDVGLTYEPAAPQLRSNATYRSAVYSAPRTAPHSVTY